MSFLTQESKALESLRSQWTELSSITKLEHLIEMGNVYIRYFGCFGPEFTCSKWPTLGVISLVLQNPETGVHTSKLISKFNWKERVFQNMTGIANVISLNCLGDSEKPKVCLEYCMSENTVWSHLWGTVPKKGIWTRSLGWVGDIFLGGLRKEIGLRTVGRCTDGHESHCLIFKKLRYN